MTLQELYQFVGGDYDQAKRVLRIDKLIDKHIRKLPTNGVVTKLIDAGSTMDPTQLFECAHAAKGVCGNLGLTSLAEVASQIAEEYRPGNARTMDDAQVRELIAKTSELYQRAIEGIRQYEA